MTAIPLALGRLDVRGHEVRRSGLRWLRGDGEPCRAGDVVAYCNLALVPEDRRLLATPPFAEEIRDFQVAFALCAGGRLRRAAGTSLGGFLDRLAEQDLWDPSQAIGQLDPDAASDGFDASREESLELLFGAGRRVAGVAEERSGFLTGWHDRARAWWGEGAAHSTLVGVGICELQGVFRGDRLAFQDWFDAAGGPAEIVHVPDHALVPCAALVAEQLRRTPADAEAIRADAWRSLAGGPDLPTPDDWVFAGALVGALLRSPLSERRELLSRGGLSRAAAPGAVLLSLNAETPEILRHRRLGYALAVHGYRVREAGVAVKRWLERDFERVARSPDDVARDLAALAAALRSRGPTAILAMNAMSSVGHEEILDYAAFDRPIGGTLASVRAKDLNLVLHDVAREHDVAIVDNDAIAASMGAAHLPDGAHNSGAMQAELRAEIVRILRARGLAGFAPRPARGRVS